MKENERDEHEKSKMKENSFGSLNSSDHPQYSIPDRDAALRENCTGLILWP